MFKVVALFMWNTLCGCFSFSLFDCSVFKECDLDVKGKLDFSEFKKFIANAPDVIQMLETALARHAWNPLDTQNREHEFYTFDPVRYSMVVYE